MKYTAVINGQVVMETGMKQETLILGDGKIQAILAPEADYAALYGDCEIVDAKGNYVVPGGIDGHVHFGGFGTVPIADDFVSGSRASLAGGNTTIVDFVNPVGQDPMEALKGRIAAGKDSAVDYAIHFTFTENYKNELPHLQEIIDLGVTAFKAYTYYDGTCLLPGDFRILMEQIHDKGSLLVHAEEKSIIDSEKARFDGDETDMSALYATRPNISEQLAVENVLAIAKETGTKLCIAHSSSKETMNIRAREKAAGNNNFILETYPHYLQFTVEDSTGPEGGLYTINPPLRSMEDRDRIREAVMKEEISILSTDHCPYLRQYKTGTYKTISCGVDGVQTRMQYLFSEFVLKQGLPMDAFVRMTSTNAAKFYNLYPQKGTIAVGSDADLAIFDPTVVWTYGKDQIMGNTDYTVFEGFPLNGKCVCTIKGGKVVMKDGVVNAEPGSGKFLKTVHKA